MAATPSNTAVARRRPRIEQDPSYVPPTYFAPLYKSIWSIQVSKINPSLIANYAHLNCSYLSTPGVAPTLTELKAHAHSLTCLIKDITISTMPGVINSAQIELDGLPTFSDGETYDFLTDLGTPYTGPKHKALKVHHEMPLTALANTVEQFTYDEEGERVPRPHGRRALTADMGTLQFRNHCPLYAAHHVPANQPGLPYATHQNLIQHANEILEMLDHEYAAKGGLLSILPPKEEVEDRKRAETTVLGQWIVYTQQLVQRLHDIERQYANAMDVLASEATVPRQQLQLQSAESKGGSMIAYPQDRFVLVNAGEDVWNFLHRELERREIIMRQQVEEQAREGVVSEKLWENRGGKDGPKGIVKLDCMTRYYRLSNDPLKTIFVIPAFEHHPGTKVTRDMESAPTVVSVVKPVWPERQTELERKARQDRQELKEYRQKYAESQRELETKKVAEEMLLKDNQVKDAEIQQKKRIIRDLRAANPTLATLQDDQQAAREATDAAAAERDALARERAAAAATRRQLEAERVRLIEQQREVNAWRCDEAVRYEALMTQGREALERESQRYANVLIQKNADFEKRSDAIIREQTAVLERTRRTGATAAGLEEDKTGRVPFTPLKGRGSAFVYGLATPNA